MKEITMNSIERQSLSRRGFLRFGGSAAAALAATSPAVRGMRVLSSSQGNPSDYRALVCVFLYGGADTFNVLVPTSAAEYGVYASARGDLAETQSSLLPIQPITSDGATYGVHGQMPGIQRLFEDGKLAFVANTGPLVRPITKAEFLAGQVPVPKNLFSHNDQQTQWQVAHADGPRTTGWAGRMLDQMASVLGASTLPPAISIESTAQLLTGVQTSPYVLGAGGAEAVVFADEPERRAALQSMLASQHALGTALGGVQSEALAIFDLLDQSLDAAPDLSSFFPTMSELAMQLRMVARMIAIRGQLGVTRQVFFVGMGGFDTHDNQTTQLPGLLGTVSSAIDGFERAVESLGDSTRVTGFTHTEFGRTLSSNGQGSDHGWGGHAMVFGGGVRGQDIYGTMPNLALDGPDDVGEGRIIPRIGVDQFAATLSRWFGLGASEVDLVFPNVREFPTSDLGFMF
ncbi:MAG: DUF1501 domain-containing protein [Planctomycetota bacterium]